MTGEPLPCERCGTPHAKCTAHTRAGRPCGQRRMRDQLVCKMHGGTSPKALAAAVRRREERAALVAAESFGLPVVVDPHTALLEELHRTAGAVAWLSALVADLDRSEVGWGKTRDKEGGEDHGRTFEAKPNVFVGLWQAERKHLVDVSRACISAGIEERRVRLAESAGQQLASVVRAVLDRLDLTVEQQTAALVVVPEEFRRLGEAGAA